MRILSTLLNRHLMSSKTKKYKRKVLKICIINFVIFSKVNLLWIPRLLQDSSARHSLLIFSGISTNGVFMALLQIAADVKLNTLLAKGSADECFP